MFSTTYKVTTSEFKKYVLNVVLCSKNRLYAMKEIGRHCSKSYRTYYCSWNIFNYNYTVGYILTCNGHKSWNFCHLIPIIYCGTQEFLSCMVSDSVLVCCFLLLQSLFTAKSL